MCRRNIILEYALIDPLYELADSDDVQRAVTEGEQNTFQESPDWRQSGFETG